MPNTSNNLNETSAATGYASSKIERGQDTPLSILKSVFGYDSFRLLQKDVIDNVLSRRDTLAVMPTGGGKSLCYQVPALLMEGLTIVISPLIALMQDQVTALCECGVSAAFLNSTLDAAAWQKTAQEVASAHVKLLYLAPESLGTRRVRSLLQSDGLKVSCITVDEAHCVSEWGHDFRPDYMQIASFRESFPDAVLLALTATATQRVRGDIVKGLNMRNACVLVSSFNRDNIYFEVQPKRDAFRQALNCINLHRGECGIVYCLSRMATESVAAKLVKSGHKALAYHAGLPPEERTKRQDDFVTGRVPIMVATIAFGMGINVPNVRFVIHYSLPKSIEQYYQEIGRAGRDGLPSHALLLYSLSDAVRIRRFFDESGDREQSERLLQAMLRYASGRTCRRLYLLSYFGESAKAGNGGKACCDVCASLAMLHKSGAPHENTAPLAESDAIPANHILSPDTTAANGGEKNSAQLNAALNDVTIPVQKFLSCILRTGEKFGASYVIRVLLGSRDRRIIENGHDKLSTYGIGSELRRADWNVLADCMESAGLIKRIDKYGVLALTGKAHTLLRTRSDILLPFKAGDVHSTLPAPALSSMDGESQKLFEALRKWRKDKAGEENVPPYIIFGDKTLRDIAQKKPRSINDFMLIYGVGEMKAHKFADAILHIVSSNDISHEETVAIAN